MDALPDDYRAHVATVVPTVDQLNELLDRLRERADVVARLKKLSLKAGDILLVRGRDVDHRMFEGIRLPGLGPHGVPILFLGDATLEAVDEERMRAAGWVRERTASAP